MGVIMPRQTNGTYINGLTNQQLISVYILEKSRPNRKNVFDWKWFDLISNELKNRKLLKMADENWIKHFNEECNKKC